MSSISTVWGKSVTVDIKDSAGGGMVTSLNIQGNTANVKLYGGTYASIATLPKTCADLLPEGYGFVNKNNGWVEPTKVYGVRNVTVQPVKTVTVSCDDSYSYGEAITFSAVCTTESSVSYQWSLKAGNVYRDIADATSAAYNPGTLDVGTYTYRCAVKVDGVTVVEECTFQVIKATPTDTPTSKTGLIYTGAAQALIEKGSVSTGCTLYYRLGTDGKWSTSIPTATNADSYTVYWYLTGGTNYENVGSEEKPAGSVKVTIAPKTVTTLAITIANGSTYDGTAKTPEVTVMIGGDTLTKDEDYTLSYSNNINAGTNTASVTVTALANRNYTWMPVTENFSIAKAGYTVTDSLIAAAKYGTSVTLNVSGYFNGGTAAVSTTEDHNSILDGAPTLENGVLTFAFKNDPALVGKTATVTISVTSCSNYKNYTFDVQVEVLDKNVPVLSVNPIIVTYTGESIPASKITGTATFNGSAVAGAWNWADEDNVPKNVLDSGSYQVIFTPTDTATYASNNTTVTVTINKATLPQPTFDPVTKSGKWLSDVSWTVEGATADLTWDDNENTKIKQGKSYGWTLTPCYDDADNYNVLTGSVVLWQQRLVWQFQQQHQHDSKASGRLYHHDNDR